MFQRFIVVVCVLTMAFTATSAFGQLANSPWPTLNHDSRFSQVTDFPGFVNGQVHFDRPAAGPIRVSPSISSAGYLYSIQGYRSLPGTMKLRRINPDTGQTLAEVSAPDSADFSQPLIDSNDNIYIGGKGAVVKWNSTLTSSTTLSLPDEVIPYGFALTDDLKHYLIFVGSKYSGITYDYLTDFVKIYAVERSTMSIVDTFDIEQWSHTPGCLRPGGSYSPCVADDGAVSINYAAVVGPGNEPYFPAVSICYVAIVQGFLFPIPFNPYGDRACANPNKNGTPCFELPASRWGEAYKYSIGTQINSKAAPTLDISGDRLYFITGYSVSLGTRIDAIITSDASQVWDATVAGPIVASPVVENDPSLPSINEIYVHIEGGSMMKFGDNGDSEELLWISSVPYVFTEAKMTGGHAALGSNNLIYVPFRFESSPSTFRAGAFDKYTGVLQLNFVSLPGEDIATRSIGNSNYVYFGTLNSRLISIK